GRRHLHGEETMRPRSLVLGSLVAGSLVLVVSGFSQTVTAQAGGRGSAAPAIDANAVYQANCATCHDQPTGRTPSKDALKERTADQILLALTSGSMSMQGVSLSVAERRALAEHLSGKPLGAAASVAAGLCTAKPAPIANLSSGS